ncbi:hypothetical protein J0656_17225 [Muricauda ruestringensis]|uniref:Uncharacterized protein n=1 Tax=Flagellimonas aurea TaxID=2915619 RepID=A0ABS3GA30_9FLAO|nr:hypothetical protein [Allomuricauda aurea]MBO0355763.1 hypothetical protein [Allomuricauda aurea]
MLTMLPHNSKDYANRRTDFCCLINGKPFFPAKFGNGRPRAFYQYVDGAYTLGISATRKANDPSKSINMGALDIEGLQTGTYTLESF